MTDPDRDYSEIVSRDKDRQGNPQVHYEDGRTTTDFGGPCAPVTTDRYGRECCAPDDHEDNYP